MHNLLFDGQIYCYFDRRKQIYSKPTSSQYMNNENFIASIVVGAWNGQIKACNKLLAELSDQQLMKDIVEGKNRGIYILGHLTAVHDRMIPLLGFGDQLYPNLNPIFIQTPDKTVETIPTLSDLRSNWDTVNEKLNSHIANMSFEQWLEKHTAVTDEDFAKEPNRNKLSVLISRTNHLANHIGQLLLLK